MSSSSLTFSLTDRLRETLASLGHAPSPSATSVTLGEVKAAFENRPQSSAASPSSLHSALLGCEVSFGAPRAPRPAAPSRIKEEALARLAEKEYSRMVSNVVDQGDGAKSFLGSTSLAREFAPVSAGLGILFSAIAAFLAVYFSTQQIFSNHNNLWPPMIASGAMIAVIAAEVFLFMIKANRHDKAEARQEMEAKARKVPLLSKPTEIPEEPSSRPKDPKMKKND
jgi:hypothetical protein